MQKIIIILEIILSQDFQFFKMKFHFLQKRHNDFQIAEYSDLFQNMKYKPTLKKYLNFLIFTLAIRVAL